MIVLVSGLRCIHVWSIVPRPETGGGGRSYDLRRPRLGFGASDNGAAKAESRAVQVWCDPLIWPVGENGLAFPWLIEFIAGAEYSQVGIRGAHPQSFRQAFGKRLHRGLHVVEARKAGTPQMFLVLRMRSSVVVLWRLVTSGARLFQQSGAARYITRFRGGRQR